MIQELVNQVETNTPLTQLVWTLSAPGGANDCRKDVSMLQWGGGQWHLINTRGSLMWQRCKHVAYVTRPLTLYHFTFSGCRRYSIRYLKIQQILDTNM